MEIVKMNSARFIEINAGVRYWEDAELNGVADSEGTIPFRVGERWVPTIDLATGEVLNWSKTLTARIYYKVCDDGDYWLLNDNHQRIAKWKGDYVPNDILCIDSDGYGDYIIFRIAEDGKIIDWKPPLINEAEWKPIIS